MTRRNVYTQITRFQIVTYFNHQLQCYKNQEKLGSTSDFYVCTSHFVRITSTRTLPESTECTKLRQAIVSYCIFCTFWGYHVQPGKSELFHEQTRSKTFSDYSVYSILSGIQHLHFISYRVRRIIRLLG